MRCRTEEDKDRFRLTAGMAGVACVTVILLLAQLQIEAGLLFGA
jgi:hypothetical protein